MGETGKRVGKAVQEKEGNKAKSGRRWSLLDTTKCYTPTCHWPKVTQDVNSQAFPVLCMCGGKVTLACLLKRATGVSCWKQKYTKVGGVGHKNSEMEQKVEN